MKEVINFSGGRGGHADKKPLHNCAPGRLVTAARSFGRTARIPTLRLYAENDTFFAPALSRRMARTFRSAGGRVEYSLLQPGGGDGHAFIHSDRAVAKWGPLVQKFLGLRG